MAAIVSGMDKPNGDDLVTPAEAHERFGVTKATFRGWSRRYEDFPEPVKQGGRGQPTLYWLPELDVWANDHALVLGIAIVSAPEPANA